MQETPATTKRVPTIQEVLGDKLQEKIDEASTQMNTLAEARVSLLTNPTIFGALPGKLELTKETLLFLPDDHQTTHVLLVGSIKKVAIGTATLRVWTDRKYSFHLPSQAAAAHTAATPSQWSMLLRQLHPNLVITSSHGVATFFKVFFALLVVAALFYFAYISTKL